jgi:hypothetical protein
VAPGGVGCGAGAGMVAGGGRARSGARGRPTAPTWMTPLMAVDASTCTTLSVPAAGSATASAGVSAGRRSARVAQAAGTGQLRRRTCLLGQLLPERQRWQHRGAEDVDCRGQEPAGGGGG